MIFNSTHDDGVVQLDDVNTAIIAYYKEHKRHPAKMVLSRYAADQLDQIACGHSRLSGLPLISITFAHVDSVDLIIEIDNCPNSPLIKLV